MRSVPAVERSLLKTFGLVALAVVVLTGAYKGEKSSAGGPAAPTASSGGLPVPLPTGAGGPMGAPMVGTTASQREINFLTQLYRLPHGTRIDPDGSWRVVSQ